MDGRDQTDTNVVRIRRKAEPSEAERKRLARTIFAEEDEVGTFSHGNLVPPPSHTSTQSRDPAQAEPDPYFERLQGTHGAPHQNGAAAESDSETTAYFDQLTSSAPDEMALMIDTPSAGPALPGSAHLPAESAGRTRGRKRKRSQPVAATARTEPSVSDGRNAPDGAGVAVLARFSTRRPGASWRRTLHLGAVGRRTRPAIVMAVALALTAGATAVAMLATIEAPRRSQTVEARTSSSSQPTMLAAVSVAFAGLEHEANATVTAAHATTARKQASIAQAGQHHPRLQRRRPVSETPTHVILTADHTAPSVSQTTTAPTATNAAVTDISSGEHQQPDQTSSHAAAVSQPTAPAAGPTGLGRVPGSNCKPKCK